MVTVVSLVSGAGVHVKIGGSVAELGVCVVGVKLLLFGDGGGVFRVSTAGSSLDTVIGRGDGRPGLIYVLENKT